VNSQRDWQNKSLTGQVSVLAGQLTGDWPLFQALGTVGNLSQCSIKLTPIAQTALQSICLHNEIWWLFSSSFFFK
jgi:hypothetical protein